MHTIMVNTPSNLKLHEICRVESGEKHVEVIDVEFSTVTCLPTKSDAMMGMSETRGKEAAMVSGGKGRSDYIVLLNLLVCSLHLVFTRYLPFVPFLSAAYVRAGIKSTLLLTQNYVW